MKNKIKKNAKSHFLNQLSHKKKNQKKKKKL